MMKQGHYPHQNHNAHLYSKEDATFRHKHFELSSNNTNNNGGDNDDGDDGDTVLNDIFYSSHTHSTNRIPNTHRSERRSLLSPQRSSPSSSSSLVAQAPNTRTNVTNDRRRKRNRQPHSAQLSNPTISIRRKMHDLRLHSILNTTDNDDDDDDFIGDSSSGGAQRRRRQNDPEDWIRPYWLGLGLFLILFSFWILDTLKDPIFGALLLSSGDGLHYNLPRAKLFSVCTTLFLVVLLEYIAKEQKKQQQTRLRLQQQQEQQNQVDIDNVVVPVRSHDDVLDGSGTWTRMNIGTSKSYRFHHEDPDPNVIQQQQQRSQIFITIGVPFCIFFAMCAYFLQFNPNTAWTAGKNNMNSSNMDASTQQAWRVLGYCIYAAVESFGSLMVATFWSYTNSTLTLMDAETYYGTIIAFAQMGAIAGSTMVTMHLWNSITLFIVACLVILLHIIVMITYNRRFPPTRPIEEENEPTRTAAKIPLRNDDSDDDVNYNNTSATDEDEPIVPLSGVRLILKHNYVLLILGVSCLYEVSLTCLNYQMTLLGWSKFEESNHGSATYNMSASSSSSTSSSSSGSNFIDMMSFTQFMGHYGQMVNVCSLLLSSFIFPTLIYRVGLKYTLRVFPTLLLLVNIIAFIAMPGNLLVLFFSMSFLKATTYSIHDPAKEILYIPTSQAIQFNAKFWIDVVGARVAKAIGSSINHLSGSVHRSIRVASAPSLITAMGLWYVCYCIGTRFDTLIANNTIVGVDDDDSDIDGDDGVYRSKVNQTDYSEEHNDDGDGRGAVQETETSFELTAL